MGGGRDRQRANPIAEDGGVTPDAFQLGQYYPNPFTPDTVIPYSLSERSMVEIAV